MDKLTIQPTRRRRRAGFKAVQPIKTQESLFAEEKSKAVHYGGFYKQVLQTSANYTAALARFCVRLETVKKRILFFENVRFAENAKLVETSTLPFYSGLDPFWDEHEFMRVDEVKELKRERILNILAEEQKELEHYVRTLIKRCTL